MAVLLFVAATPHALAGNTSDAEGLEIVQKHCVMCHADKPTHESFQEAPKKITLEAVADLIKYAAAIYAQTVRTKAMPLGNQTGMTDDERAIIGQWLKDLP